MSLELNETHCMDNVKGMRLLPDNYIDLTVTSPPYDDLRNYKGCDWNFEIFKDVARELYRVTKDGGVVVWVVGDKTCNFNETGTSFKQALFFKEIGFNLLDTMIYIKENYAPAYPSMKRYANQFEYMFILSKGKPTTFNPKQVPKTAKRQGKRKFRQADGTLIEKVINNDYDFKNATNVWSYSTGGSCTKDKIAFEHPAIFPEKLAQDHILSWSNEGDIVMDIFAGSGTVRKMCRLNNRQYIGFEIAEEYVKIDNERNGNCG